MKKITVVKGGRVIVVECDDPCTDFIMGGCGICPPSCHQPIFDKDGNITNDK